jgi:hypothetical protein
VALRPYDGPARIDEAGTVLDGVDSTVCLRVAAPDVVIRRSRIRCGGHFGIVQDDGAAGLVVEDTEITGEPAGEVDRAISLTRGAVVRRTLVHGTRRGIAVGHDTTVEDSFIGDNVNPTAAHSTGIGASGGATRVVIRRNTVETVPGTNASAALALYPERWAGGPNSDVLIEGNLFNSGGDYAVYLGHSVDRGESPNTSVRVVGNRFGTRFNRLCGSAGAVASWSEHPSNRWEGNTWYDQGHGGVDGAPVLPGGDEGDPAAQR